MQHYMKPNFDKNTQYVTNSEVKRTWISSNLNPQSIITCSFINILHIEERNYLNSSMLLAI